MIVRGYSLEGVLSMHKVNISMLVATLTLALLIGLIARECYWPVIQG